MFPGVYGFTWDAGNLLFLGIFFTVAIIIVTTIALAALRAWRDVQQGKQDSIRWQEEFHDLPVPLRVCRHELSGELKHRTCPNGFDCRRCEFHASLVPPDTKGSSVPGIYHRGHTWVQKDSEGNYLIGLDDIATKILGTPDAVALPEPGTALHVNGRAFSLQKNSTDVRILSPVDGVVIGRGSEDDDWLLKVRARDTEEPLTHLLSEREAEAWKMRELERLEIRFGGQSAPALADGGELLDELPSRYPNADWDRVWAETFLES